MENQIPDSQSDSSLPMIVYLRGDEDCVEQFCIDADQAMHELGIKRSRLTQISGRELRVGRIRKDRYIRPVYRPQDIRDYQSWTRSTASHQSSSLLIEQTMGRLEKQCEQLAEDSERLRHLSQKSLEDFWQQETNRIYSMLRALSESLRLSKQDQQQLVAGKFSAISSYLEKIFSHIENSDRKIAKALADIREIELQFHKELVEVNARLTRLTEKLAAQIDERVAQMDKSLREVLETQQTTEPKKFRRSPVTRRSRQSWHAVCSKN